MKKMTFLLAGLLLLIVVLVGIKACGPATETEKVVVSTVEPPAWSINANIYEVNTRQFTPEGTFAAFEEHLDRLQDLGVNILWFMPVQPIGEKNRKGTLGSYYSIANYTAINPEYGTMEDFRHLVDAIHERGMYVILDWVANHTAWDHHWTKTHPHYFDLDEDGNFRSPNEDWSDVIQLDYDNEELRDAMIAEMRFWIEDVGIDGFRCDVADYVPTDFWVRARTEFEAIKPVFMLAEAENPELHKEAFEAGYGWRFHHIMNDVAKGDKNVEAIDNYFFEENAGNFPAGSYKMYFITNHDENSWAGTEFDRMGDGVEAFAVLTVTVPGMVLLYNGQEAGFDRMLEFFEKDQIDWDDFKYHDFYKTLLGLKARNKALWNGNHGGEIIRVNTCHDSQIFAFVREKDGDKVLVAMNLADEAHRPMLMGEHHYGTYRELFTGETHVFERQMSIELEPWGYKVFEGI
jgi:cyclomaltodextrinase / maltogenic alpha-amylase / neopullulanase